MIVESLIDAQYWHWAVAGLVLLILEIFAPGAIFLWFGIAALVVSVLKAIFPTMGWELQLIIFSVLSIASIISWRLFFKRNPPKEDPESNTLNRRGSEFLGRKIELTTAIVDGVGKVKLGDTMWRVEGPNAAVGTQVTVVACKGSSLVVEKAS